MILAYRNFRSQLGTCIVNISRTAERDDAGSIRKIKERWQIQGQILASSAATLKNYIAIMENAFAYDGGDLVLYLPDGRTPSAHAMYSRQSISGVRIATPPSYPNGQGVECATVRSFFVELEAEFFSAGARQNILKFEEAIDISGGGFRQGMIEKPRGIPTQQVFRERTICFVNQSGSAIGLYRQPIVPPPLFPQYLVDEYPRWRVGSGTYNGSLGSTQSTEIPVSWAYEMQLPFRPRSVQPNVWTE